MASIDHFERLDPSQAPSTCKLASRSDVQRLATDPGALLAGDFLGRLISLFGPLDGDGLVLRHLPSGLVVTAYAAQSGPSYGGAPGERGADAGDEPLAMVVGHLRIVAALRRGEDVSAQQEEQRARWRRAAAVTCPAGFVGAVEELEELLSKAPLTDFELVDDSSDFGPRRIGVRDGVPFEEPLSIEEAFAHDARRLEAAATDDDHGALLVAMKMFSRFTELGRQRRRWVPLLRRVWMSLLDRAEKLAGRAPAPSMCELLAERAEEMAVDDSSSERLRTITRRLK